MSGQLGAGALAAGAVAAWVAAMLSPWRSSGTGSTVSLGELLALAARGRLPSDTDLLALLWAPVVAVAAYTALLPVRGVGGTRVRVVALVVLAGATAAVVFAGAGGPATAGPGPFLTAAGALAAAGGECLRSTSRQRREPETDGSSGGIASSGERRSPSQR